MIDPGHQIPDASAFDVIGRLMTVTPAVPRLLGSAVVSLATVAWTGGCFVGTGLNIWDAAAGVLLAEERGRIAQWWRYARDGHHHLIVGDPDLVRAYEHSMPKFIEAWRRKADNPHIAASELLGPSPTLLN